MQAELPNKPQRREERRDWRERWLLCVRRVSAVYSALAFGWGFAALCTCGSTQLSEAAVPEDVKDRRDACPTAWPSSGFEARHSFDIRHPSFPSHERSLTTTAPARRPGAVLCRASRSRLDGPRGGADLGRGFVPPVAAAGGPANPDAHRAAGDALRRRQPAEGGGTGDAEARGENRRAGRHRGNQVAVARRRLRHHGEAGAAQQGASGPGVGQVAREASRGAVAGRLLRAIS